ncbi:YraN family protein [Paracoccus sp. SSK6]|uniref:YraN family protein n=1 Tax=Paracoccus sp. SSK6 TaxID=3143131 RepID=UPI00321B2C31
MGYGRGSDFAWAQPVAPKPVSAARRTRGRLAHLAGTLAEDGVARHLEGRGMTVLARRWRGKAGEIDLICQAGQCLIFVEVKQSATHGEAAQRLGAAQQGRIMRAALEYCEKEGHAPLPEMRFDAALVDGQGRIEVLERAFEEAFA